MANNPSTLPDYNGQVNPPDADYPYGSARDDVSPGDLTGTPRVAAELKDLQGFQQAMLSEAGEVPTGAPDTATDSQYLKAVKNLLSKRFAATFGTIADLKNGSATDGVTVNFQILAAVGAKVQWLGYFGASDGGSNWGTVKTGAHTGDDATIFSIDANTYVEANLKGKRVNLRKFGVKADEINDDTSALQVALTRSGAYRLAGGTVLISSQLVASSGLDLEFLEGAVLKQADNSNVTNMLYGDGVSVVKLTGVEFDINSANQPDYIAGQEPNKGRAAFFINSSGISVNGVSCPEMFGTVLFFIDSSDISVERADINDVFGRFTAFGVYLVRVATATVSKSSFRGVRNFGGDSSSFGVQAKDSVTDITVDKCYFNKMQCILDGSENSPTPVNLGSNLKITNCTLIDPIADTTIRYCRFGVMSNNINRGSGDFGLSVGDSEHVVVDSNIVENSNTVGIGIRKCDNVVVSNNVLRDPCTNFKGVSLVENQRAGIYVLGDARRIIIEGNNITDFETAPNKMFHAIRVEDFAGGIKGDDTSFALIGDNICQGASSGVDIYADSAENVLLPTNFRSDGKNTPVKLGSDPFAVSELGDLRNNAVDEKPFYYDGTAWRSLPKIVDVPATATSPGKKGDIAFNSSFFYVCVSTDVWVRTGLATW